MNLSYMRLITPLVNPPFVEMKGVRAIDGSEMRAYGNEKKYYE